MWKTLLYSRQAHRRTSLPCYSVSTNAKNGSLSFDQKCLCGPAVLIEKAPYHLPVFKNEYVTLLKIDVPGRPRVFDIGSVRV